MGKKLFLVYRQLPSCCILTWLKKSQLVLWSLLIKVLILFMRVWEGGRVRGKRGEGERERKRENRKSFQKVCTEREREIEWSFKEDMEGESLFFFKRKVLILKSQMGGCSREAEDHIITSHLMRPLHSSSYPTKAFDTVHSSSGKTFLGFHGMTLSIFPFIL